MDREKQTLAELHVMYVKGRSNILLMLFDNNFWVYICTCIYHEHAIFYNSAQFFACVSNQKQSFENNENFKEKNLSIAVDHMKVKP